MSRRLRLVFQANEPVATIDSDKLVIACVRGTARSIHRVDVGQHSPIEQWVPRDGGEGDMWVGQEYAGCEPCRRSEAAHDGLELSIVVNPDATAFRPGGTEPLRTPCSNFR